MNISIFASIGSQNLGDELILKNEIRILEKKYSEKLGIDKDKITFNVFTYDLFDNFYNAKNIEYIEYFPIDIKNKKNIFRNIRNFINFIKIVKKSDLIVVGGGGIIYDNELQSVGGPLKQWAFRSKIFNFFKKKVEFFRVGINIKNNKNLNIVKEIFSCAENISVRDNYSFDLLKNLGFEKNLKLLIDPVFSDNKLEDFTINNSILNSFSLQEKEAHFNLKGIMQIEELRLERVKSMCGQISGEKIGIALRDQKIDNYKNNIIEIIKYFLEKKCEIILIPHSFHKTDEKANDFIFFEEILKTINNSPIIPFHKGDENKCRDVCKVYICKTMQESYGIYINKKIDLNLASRLHSIILSQVYSIDFIGISYSTKTDEVLNMLRKD